MGPLLVGTAGHVDHGKSSLVECLTGIDTDKLPEEKKRGISIELGFAHMKLPSGRTCAFIDVPGHEKFIKTMVAGSHSLDAALLVISSVEGIRLQTREHLQVLSYLRIPQLIVVLSKCDLVSSDLIEQRKKEITSAFICHPEATAEGSIFPNSNILLLPCIIPFSSKTLLGKERLIQKLDSIESHILNQNAPFRLYVDRIFTLKGFGTVAAGTILEGIIQEGDCVFIQGRRKCRVRKLHSHGNEIQKAKAGQRVALNLSNVSCLDILRGYLLTKSEESFCDEYDVAVEFCRNDAKGMSQSFQLHVHSSRTIAKTTHIGSGYARIKLTEPLYLKPGDRFVLRSFKVDENYGSVCGGGIILHYSFLRRPHPEFLLLHDQYLVNKNEKNYYEFLYYYLDKINPMGVPVLEFNKMFHIDKVCRSKPFWKERGIDIFFSDTYFILKKHFEILRGNIILNLKDYFRNNPFKEGAFVYEVVKKNKISKECLDFIVDNSVEFQIKDDLLYFKNKESTPMEQCEKIEDILREARFTPPTIKEISMILNLTEKETLDILNGLVHSHKIKRIKYDFYIHADIFKALEEKIKLRFKELAQLDMSDFKQLTGASRKFTIPLVEYCDQIMLTLRRGDKRILNHKSTQITSLTIP
ncbi:MAG: selenocysteine-specific translation elongation factor [Deltaproteobacteria bacterium]|nr:selenocysteine-specific translation elongation factor [Deltaproteobacteria bacterium]